MDPSFNPDQLQQLTDMQKEQFDKIMETVNKTVADVTEKQKSNSEEDKRLAWCEIEIKTLKEMMNYQRVHVNDLFANYEVQLNTFMANQMAEYNATLQAQLTNTLHLHQLSMESSAPLVPPISVRVGGPGGRIPRKHRISPVAQPQIPGQQLQLSGRIRPQAYNNNVGSTYANNDLHNASAATIWDKRSHSELRQYEQVYLVEGNRSQTDRIPTFPDGSNKQMASQTRVGSRKLKTRISALTPERNEGVYGSNGAYSSKV